jgi:hypothetical protein
MRRLVMRTVAKFELTELISPRSPTSSGHWTTRSHCIVEKSRNMGARECAWAHHCRRVILPIARAVFLPAANSNGKEP